MEGYHIYGGGVPQVTNPGKQTNIKVLCPPGTEHKEIYNIVQNRIKTPKSDYISIEDMEEKEGTEIITQQLPKAGIKVKEGVAIIAYN